MLRADFNVPMEDGKLVDDFKLRALLPTLELIYKNSKKCIILTHFGRPKNQDPNLSTKPLADWLCAHNFDVGFAHKIDQIKTIDNKFVLLENLRFFDGEDSGDESFAKSLAELGDIFVFDAFGVSHRKTASTTKLPKLFDSEQKFIGLLMAKEVDALTKFVKSPLRPYSIVMGGVKLEKTDLIKSFVNLPCELRPDNILIGGGLANKLMDDPEGKKLHEELLVMSQQNSVQLVLPTDFVERKDIGSESIAKFGQIISESRRVFCNGTMGVFEEPGFEAGTREVLRKICEVSKSGMTVAGGGDCVRAVHKFGLELGFSFVSTGGGATLAFLTKNDFGQSAKTP